MANTSEVRKVKHGAATIYYILGRDNKGHNGKRVRNELVVPYNMHRGGSYIDQMQPYWGRSSDRHVNQVLSMVIGFSRNEINPDDPNAPFLAVTLVQGFFEDLEKQGLLPIGHQMFFACQKDGKNGLIHVHVVINDVNMFTYKGIPKGMDYGPNLTRLFQEYCEKRNLFQLDHGEKTAEKIGGVSYTRMERVLREEGKPVFKDFVRERIDEAILLSDDFDSFNKNLKDRDITLEFQESKKGFKRFKYTIDKNVVPNELERKSNNYSLRSTSIGTKYSPAAIETFFDLKKQIAKEQERNASKKPIATSTLQVGSSHRQSLLEETAAKGSINLDDLNDFIAKYFDRYADIEDHVERFKQVQAAFDEYRLTGKAPGEEEESSESVFESVAKELGTEEPMMVPVVSDEDEEEEQKKEETVVSIKASEQQDLKAIYSQNKKAVTRLNRTRDDALVKALMRKADSIPDTPSNDDKQFE